MSTSGTRGAAAAGARANQLNFASGWAWVVMGGLFALLAMGAVVAAISGN